MARDITPAFKTAGRAQLVRPIVLAEIDTISGNNVYVWNGKGNKDWNGHTWIGLWLFAGMGQITETSDMSANGLKLSLSLPSDLLQEALTDLGQNKPALVWFGFLDTNGDIIANPYRAYKGKVDIVDHEDTGETSTLSITVETDQILHHRAQGTRYTSQDQKAIFPDDRGFDFVDKIQETNISLGISGRLPLQTSTGE